ncbi:winged helix-turn-helix domain-containing protein [Helicobacter sp. MIT 14-3879]|uniref:winged helix-turn-helix domain-containing protein n=1 Tax=Helicobacter sp. MIT 14-3879 TaxID=2040649 RepID=UPI000E1EC252|nr:LysR family transcriptional regulator [Helicobacter sp. MIT 14-3879]RDU64812.1 molybdenum-pterin-binding protein [Helicobacter sp. MIT 14-3879]
MNVYGRFWIKKDDKNYLGIGRVELLKGIVKTGSIAQSAKAMRMSYKAAWDSIDAINNLSSSPLVKSFIGGQGGSGTKLTEDGLKAIDAFDEFQNAKDTFCGYFSNIKDLDDLKNRAIDFQKMLNK